MEILLLILGVAAFLYALVSARMDRTIITPPMIFTAVGVTLALMPSQFAEQESAQETLRAVAEFTLVIVLFIDASRIDLSLFVREHKIAVRLLAIGLPLTILAGAIVAKLMFAEFSFWEAALVAAILAPTDAALGQAVVSSPKVPIRIRQSLNVESGLNDGIALPLVMLLAALASIGTNGEDKNWMVYWLMQVSLGPLVGVIVGFGGGYLLSGAKKLNYINEDFLRLSGVALAIVAWAGALQVGGNGFIAAFVAGMSISYFADDVGDALREFGETEGQLLGLVTFLLFGLVVLVPAIESADATCYLYSILSLTVIRMLPVAAALFGLRLHVPTVLFLGWFGPRGLASLLFGLLVISEFNLPHADQILTLSVLTVVMSILAHGITAVPGSDWYAHVLKRRSNEHSLENQHCQSHRNKFKSADADQNVL
ncbi:cation:proton antiporter [Rubripirellula amarantea]|nr:cation:proton antiporter [Rubripirellula amarantea]